METAANITFYVQPVKAENEFCASVDVSRTAVLRHTVASLDEARAALSSARKFASALAAEFGGKFVVKTSLTRSPGRRAPNGVAKAFRNRSPELVAA